MTNILQKIKHEFLQILPPTIFFFFAFNIVAITTALILKGQGIEDGGFMEAHQHLLREVVWPRFWAIQIWFVVLFFFYSMLVELVRALGKERVLKMFFGRG